MQIAVVGAGIAGLVAARSLHERHDITIFEAAEYAGGHTNTIEVHGAHGTHSVDTGFIVYNEHNYPNFTRLLGDLDVATEPSNMSFGVSATDGSLAYSSLGLRGVFAQRRNIARPRFIRMLMDIRRFWADAHEYLESGIEDLTLGEFLEINEYSDAFKRGHVLPMGAAIWSTDPAKMLQYPARSLLEFFDNHGLLALRGRPRWRVVSGGSKSYVERLIAPFRDRIRLNTPVAEVRRDSLGTEIRLFDDSVEHYDIAVLAVHADQALRILGDADSEEQRILGAFTFQDNEAVLHTDASVMPKAQEAWASWNFHLTDSFSTPASENARAAVTYHMNRLQNLDTADDYFVTLNHTDAIDPAKVIRKIDYAHPVFDAAAVEAQRESKRIQGVRSTYYCGAWCGHGFHEDGVVAGLEVARSLGAEVEW